MWVLICKLSSVKHVASHKGQRRGGERKGREEVETR